MNYSNKIFTRSNHKTFYSTISNEFKWIFIWIYILSFCLSVLTLILGVPGVTAFYETLVFMSLFMMMYNVFVFLIFDTAHFLIKDRHIYEELNNINIFCNVYVKEIIYFDDNSRYLNNEQQNFCEKIMYENHTLLGYFCNKINIDILNMIQNIHRDDFLESQAMLPFGKIDKGSDAELAERIYKFNKDYPPENIIKELSLSDKKRLEHYLSLHSVFAHILVFKTEDDSIMMEML